MDTDAKMASTTESSVWSSDKKTNTNFEPLSLRNYHANLNKPTRNKTGELKKSREKRRKICRKKITKNENKMFKCGWHLSGSVRNAL